ncbi:AroM family protein [Geobacillus subterraneus]|uniref:AroM family protein n=1 Tax=Geobacillus subterraneus TaxID=129338 RepID=UPI00160C9DD4
MTKKLGVVTIGQAPRTDVGPILEKYIGDKADIIQVGVLDGMTKEEIKARLYPGKNDYVLTSRMVTGEPVTMSREKIAPIMQQRINSLEDAGCKQILVLCTGVFHGLTTRKALLIEPDQIITPTIAAIVKNRKLGVIVPLEEQRRSLLEKWRKYGVFPVFAVASPYQFSKDSFEKAAEVLKSENVDIILLDCMGYVEEFKRIVEESTGLSVILSNALMAKIVSEMI